jgi:hypothetical protein
MAKELENPIARSNLTAAYLLKYWADKGMIPNYEGLIEELRLNASKLESENA